MTTSTNQPETVATETYRLLQQRFQEQSKLAGIVRPYDPEQWERVAGPPDAAELAEMEQFLRELNDERECSLAREAGVAK